MKKRGKKVIFIFLGQFSRSVVVIEIQKRVLLGGLINLDRTSFQEMTILFGI